MSSDHSSEQREHGILLYSGWLSPTTQMLEATRYEAIDRYLSEQITPNMAGYRYIKTRHDKRLEWDKVQSIIYWGQNWYGTGG